MDDEAISCGGLIQCRVQAGGTVFVGVVHGRKYDYGREDEKASLAAERADFLQAKRVLGYQCEEVLNMPEGEPAQVGYYRMLEPIESWLFRFRPQEVIVPAGDDLNQDHRFLNHVLGIALRPVNLGSVVRVLEFFALDSSLRQPSYFVEVTEAQARTKLAAIAAYRREARSGTSPRAPDNVLAQMKVWGAACGSPLAEAYRLRFAREQNEGSNNRVKRVHRHEPDVALGQNGAGD